MSTASASGSSPVSPVTKNGIENNCTDCSSSVKECGIKKINKLKMKGDFTKLPRQTKASLARMNMNKENKTLLPKSKKKKATLAINFEKCVVNKKQELAESIAKDLCESDARMCTYESLPMLPVAIRQQNFQNIDFVNNDNNALVTDMYESSPRLHVTVGQDDFPGADFTNNDITETDESSPRVPFHICHKTFPNDGFQTRDNTVSEEPCGTLPDAPSVKVQPYVPGNYSDIDDDQSFVIDSNHAGYDHHINNAVSPTEGDQEKNVDSNFYHANNVVLEMKGNQDNNEESVVNVELTNPAKSVIPDNAVPREKQDRVPHEREVTVVPQEREDLYDLVASQQRQLAELQSQVFWKF